MRNVGHGYEMGNFFGMEWGTPKCSVITNNGKGKEDCQLAGQEIGQIVTERYLRMGATETGVNDTDTIERVENAIKKHDGLKKREYTRKD